MCARISKAFADEGGRLGWFLKSRNGELWLNGMSDGKRSLTGIQRQVTYGILSELSISGKMGQL